MTEEQGYAILSLLWLIVALMIPVDRRFFAFCITMVLIYSIIASLTVISRIFS